MAFDRPGIGHPKKVCGLTEALIRRGYSDSDIELCSAAISAGCWASP